MRTSDSDAINPDLFRDSNIVENLPVAWKVTLYSGGWMSVSGKIDLFWTGKSFNFTHERVLLILSQRSNEHTRVGENKRFELVQREKRHEPGGTDVSSKGFLKAGNS